MTTRDKIKLTKTSVSLLESETKVYDLFDSVQNRFGVRVHPTGRKTYFYTYRNKQGKRQRITLGVHGDITAEQARKAAEKTAGVIANGEDPKQEAIKSKYGTFGEFLDHSYKPWRTAERKQAEEEMAMLKRNFEHWYKLPIEQITVELVTKWRSEKINNGLHFKTVNRYIAGLKSALSFAVKMGVIDKSPISEVKALKIDDREKVRFLSDDEEKRLRKVLDQREGRLCKERQSANEWRKSRGYELLPDRNENSFADHIKPMVLLLLNTGCRPIEILTLNWRDVSLDQKVLTVDGSNAKSGKTRHIPLSNEAQLILKQWKKQGVEGLVFPSPATGYEMDKLPRTITKLIADAHIENFRPYDLRHTFASRLAMAGIDLNTIRELLGHEDISTTLIYAHLSEDHKREAINKVFI